MSTAVDTAFEELVSHGDTAEYKHAVCAMCYPDLDRLPPDIVTICGQYVEAKTWHARRSRLAKCSTCLTRVGWPCGHC
jgi:hypothetical protein